MNLRDARIGYGGYSRDFSVPGDRRRFAAYARLKGLPIDYAKVDRPYDLAYVTYSSDLPGWVARKRREGDKLKLVFELIDSYFTETGLPRRFLKGSARRLLGTDSIWSPDLRRTLIDACEAADAIVCSTEEQRDVIRRFNPNVFLSFDYFGEELGPPKSDYARTGKLKLVWEGQATTLPNLTTLREPINALRGKVELHVVTDPIVHAYFGRFGASDSRRLLDGFACETHFHPWDRATFASHVKAADLALIPIDRDNALWWGKPENKLAMFWQLGLPVLTSPTPAYARAMTASGLDMTCATPADWTAALGRFASADSASFQSIGTLARAYAATTYSPEAFVGRLDRVFASICIGVN